MNAVARCSVGFLLLAVAAAVFAPILPLRDPLAQPDGLVLRELPPLSRVDAVELADGTRIFAHEIRKTGKSIGYRRGTQWSSVDRTRLATRWHRRPLYVLGTDDLGRDSLSRLVYGARLSLLVGFGAASLALLLGVGIGCLAGLAGGWVDAALMRATDFALSLPRLFLALMLAAVYGASLLTTVVVVGVTTWMGVARLTRGVVMSVREHEFVAAARAAGSHPLRVATRHVLPATFAPVAVEWTLKVADAILLEASLSFLGMGVPPPAPTWGNLIADGRGSLFSAWWIATLPGLAVGLTVVALSLVADAYFGSSQKPTPGLAPRNDSEPVRA